MTREDIIRMAREAQMPFYWRTGEITYLDKLERFATLVASAERDACALICENFSDHDSSMKYLQQHAYIIRARGQA